MCIVSEKTNPRTSQPASEPDPLTEKEEREAQNEQATEKREGAKETGGTATKSPPQRKKTPGKTPPRRLPPWKVLLHNDDKHDMLFVIETILMLTPLKQPEAVKRMFEAHHSGASLLMTVHRERAELYQEQFTSRGLSVTIEPA